MADIFLHSSNYKWRYELLESATFISVPFYDPHTIAHENEWGFIPYGRHRLRILLGKIRKPLDKIPPCHWCKGVQRELVMDGFRGTKERCFQCLTCGSRGPVLNTNPMVQIDADILKECHTMMIHRYNTIPVWDDDIKEAHDGYIS